MRLSTIRSLRPNVTREDAVRTLEPRGLLRLLSPAGRSGLRCIADAYVPYRLYEVRFEGMNGRAAAQARLLALDAVEGALDLFEFPRVPGEDELLTLETRNYLEPALEESRARQLLAEKALRIAFQQGFFRIRQPRFALQLIPLEFYIPYWLGFYGADGAVRCRVLDAVRRRVEGSKARAFFEHWLAA